MATPFESDIYGLTFPESISRNSPRSYQPRSFRGRRSIPTVTPIRRTRSHLHLREYVSVLESYSHGPPVYPSYLNNTIYAQLVEEQYGHYCQKYITNSKHTIRKPQTRRQYALYSDLVDTTMSRTVFFEEVDTKPVRTLSPIAHDPLKHNSFLSRLELQDLRLPTAWSIFDRGDGLDLGRDSNEISFKGNSDDQASIRSNYSIKRQCGLFYYEVKIETGDRENDGHVSIGLCGEFSRLDRLPGCDEGSYGYHGECGYLTGGPVAHNNGDRKYDASFGIGDTIGCGIDFSNNTLFYTKNGIHLGTAFSNIEDKELYPFVGFRSAGEKVTTNFGQGAPFAFDIIQYRKGVADRLVNDILSTTPFVAPPTDVSHKPKSSLMDHLVMDYLNQAGYIGTCLKMKNEMTGDDRGQDQERLERLKARQDICAALRNGQIDKVFIKCEQHYPQMLQHHPRLLFRLECQKFIDLVKSLGHRPKKMEIKAGDKRRRSMLDAMDVDDDNDEYNWCDLQAVMDFGRYIRQTYAPKATIDKASSILKVMDGSKDDFAGVDVQSELKSTFSALAYEDPTDNPTNQLYEPGWRDKMASELNDAILVTEGGGSISSLENLYRQTNVALHELILNGNGQASMIPSLDRLF